MVSLSGGYRKVVCSWRTAFRFSCPGSGIATGVFLKNRNTYHMVFKKKTQAISTDPPNLRKMRLGVNKFSININGIPHPKQFKAMFLAGHTFSLAVGRKLDFRCHLLPGFILGPSWLWAWDLGYKSFSKRLPAVTICMQETSGGFKRDIGKYRNVHTTENLHK